MNDFTDNTRVFETVFRQAAKAVNENRQDVILLGYASAASANYCAYERKKRPNFKQLKKVTEGVIRYKWIMGSLDFCLDSP